MSCTTRVSKNVLHEVPGIAWWRGVDCSMLSRLALLACTRYALRSLPPLRDRTGWSLLAQRSPLGGRICVALFFYRDPDASLPSIRGAR